MAGEEEIVSFEKPMKLQQITNKHYRRTLYFVMNVLRVALLRASWLACPANRRM